MQKNTPAKPRARRKVLALASAGVILGIGTAATLAAWNDNEWVFGGTDGAAGVGTSEFNVQQNTLQASATGFPDAWIDHETEPEAGSLTFSPGALALTPGDTVYAPVALQTESGSIAADVTLQAAVTSTVPTSNDPDGLLWGALTYAVNSSTTAADCTDEASFDAFGSSVVAVDTALGADPLAASTQTLSANAGNTQYYCFAITLPESPDGIADLSTLQGLSVAPAWRFAAESD